MKNILMIDLETTGTKPGCKVLSLGAFGFNTHGQQVQFYKRFDTLPQEINGLTDDASTIEWWRKQEKAAFDEAFGGKDDPETSIKEFNKWFAENFNTGKGENFAVWSCGIDFDFPILAEFMARFCQAFPWKFWMQNDYRTIKNLFPAIRRSEGNIAKHTALEDAKAQMRGLRAFFIAQDQQ